MRHRRIAHLDHALFDLHYITSIIPLKVMGHLVLLDERRYGVFG